MPDNRMTVGTTTRERRVMAGGAAIVVMALALTFLLLPGVRRWQEREARLHGARAELDTLRALVAAAPQLDSAATAQEERILASGRRVIRARSAALAASALQSLLQDAADASRLVVTRLDVAPTAGDGASEAANDDARIGAADPGSLPATLAAYGDIHGLASLLQTLADGPRVVAVERMTVQLNSALRGAPDVLQITLVLRAPVVLE